MIKKGVEKVAVVKCKSYSQKQVDKAIRKILKLLDFDEKEKSKYKKILIKPNVVGAYKDNLAIVTHPSIVRSIIKQFKGEIFVGESSFMDTEKAFKGSGYSGFANLVVFEKSNLIKIKDKNAKVLRDFYFPKIIKQADLVVNVPKLKTHSLTMLSGAIKNLYGCIPGGMKQVLHKKAIGDKKFSSLLVDIYRNVNPGLNIMDCVVAMEGNGPTSGKLKKVGLIMASRNAVALDIAAAKIMGFKPRRILFVKEAIKRKLYPSYEIEVIGDVKEIPNLRFEKPASWMKESVKIFLGKLIKGNKIVVDKEKCVKCATCAKKCPGKAITLNPYPEINRKKCIRCFCCIEICPEHAMHLKETKFRKFVRKIRDRRK
ncbi:MAG: DUF362 domain-containing protein [Nanoarchaeota archaeon]|nr:DUF362 domain-containing protein [Nanoarchaeota archaeon]